MTLLGVLAAGAAGAAAGRDAQGVVAPGARAEHADRAARASSGPARNDAHQRRPQDDVIYFLLPDRFANADTANDRGGLTGDRLATGFDPTSKAFYHGGDLAGVLAQLDYIQSLGATAIWLAPVFKNKPVQGAPAQE